MCSLPVCNFGISKLLKNLLKFRNRNAGILNRKIICFTNSIF